MRVEPGPRGRRELTDEEKVAEFLRSRKATKCVVASARGTDYTKATAKGIGTRTTWTDAVSRSSDSPEQRLAKAKLLTMFECLAGRCWEAADSGTKRAAQIDAVRWFFSEMSDFDWWCEQAGYEPERVRQRARDVQEHDLPTSKSALRAIVKEQAPKPVKRSRRDRPALDDSQVEPIRRLMAEGLSDEAIGMKYGFGSLTVANFRRRYGMLRPKGRWGKSNQVSAR